jgi:hypothetical protein
MSRIAHPPLSLDDLKEWNDGTTVCPPCLIGRYDALCLWSLDALSALAGGKAVPDPREYVDNGECEVLH